MGFKDWLLKEDDFRTGAKLGLYPNIADSLGQYPPLAITPAAADFITYYSLEFSKRQIKSLAPGIIDPKDAGHKKDTKFKYTLPL